MTPHFSPSLHQGTIGLFKSPLKKRGRISVPDYHLFGESDKELVVVEGLI